VIFLTIKNLVDNVALSEIFLIAMSHEFLEEISEIFLTIMSHEFLDKIELLRYAHHQVVHLSHFLLKRIRELISEMKICNHFSTEKDKGQTQHHLKELLLRTTLAFEQ